MSTVKTYIIQQVSNEENTDNWILDLSEVQFYPNIEEIPVKSDQIAEVSSKRILLKITRNFDFKSGKKVNIKQSPGSGNYIFKQETVQNVSPPSDSKIIDLTRYNQNQIFFNLRSDIDFLFLSDQLRDQQNSKIFVQSGFNIKNIVYYGGDFRGGFKNHENISEKYSLINPNQIGMDVSLEIENFIFTNTIINSIWDSRYISAKSFVINNPIFSESPHGTSSSTLVSVFNEEFVYINNLGMGSEITHWERSSLGKQRKPEKFLPENIPYSIAHMMWACVKIGKKEVVFDYKPNQMLHNLEKKYIENRDFRKAQKLSVSRQNFELMYWNHYVEGGIGNRLFQWINKVLGYQGSYWPVFSVLSVLLGIYWSKFYSYLKSCTEKGDSSNEALKHFNGLIEAISYLFKPHLIEDQSAKLWGILTILFIPIGVLMIKHAYNRHSNYKW